MQRLTKPAIKMSTTICQSRGQLFNSRWYAIRAEPSIKKKKSKTPEKSKVALENAKNSSKTTSAKKASPKGSPKKNTKSTVHVGTDFENRCIELLQKNFSMSLDRIAGPGDGGVDLAGWWWLPRLEGLPLNPLKPSEAPTAQGEEINRQDAFSRVRIIAQCKAEKSKVGPKYVREMEGVLHRLLQSRASLLIVPSNSNSGPPDNGSDLIPNSLSPAPTVAMLISLSRFTRAAIARAMSSPIPFILLHLPAPSEQSGDAKEDENMNNAVQPSLQWNPVLGSEKGLLGGDLEIRWERASDAEQAWPSLWWKGEKLLSCVPE